MDAVPPLAGIPRVKAPGGSNGGSEVGFPVTDETLVEAARVPGPVLALTLDDTPDEHQLRRTRWQTRISDSVARRTT